LLLDWTKRRPLKAAMAAMGISDAMSERAVQAPAGVPVGTIIAKREADLGFQQLSELLHVPGINVVGPLPREIQAVTVFSAGIGSSSSQVEHAGRLVAYLTSPEAAAAKRQHGMESKCVLRRLCRKLLSAYGPNAARRRTAVDVSCAERASEVNVQNGILAPETRPSAFGPNFGHRAHVKRMSQMGSEAESETRLTLSRRRSRNGGLMIRSKSLYITKESSYRRARVVSEFLEHRVNIVLGRKSSGVISRPPILIRGSAATRHNLQAAMYSGPDARLFAHDDPPNQVRCHAESGGKAREQQQRPSR
jgi:hypothetical protein